VFGLHT